MRSVLSAACILVFTATPALANPALEGYANYEALTNRVAAIGMREGAEARSLGKTREGRDIWLIAVGEGERDQKPGMLVVGDVMPGEVIGSEIVLRLAEQLLGRAQDDEAIRTLLAQRTFYFLPRPAPDAAERCFQKPYRESLGNGAPADDDRDFRDGEDPPDDLNGDGWITVMRVEDIAGEYIVHPADARVMIRADLAKQERGRYKLLVEGRDDDGDGQLNEDPGDGVSFNRNFTFQYPAFKPHAGPNAVSEAETRAVADFCFDHPNIAAVFTMSPEDNLLHPWKADPGKDKNRIRTTILSDDAKYQDVIAQKYQNLQEAKGAPGPSDGEGSFSKWAYFHYGRWSWAARAWWVPPTEGEQKIDEKRGADDINALRYFDEHKIEGFVDWKVVEHPDFPDQKVEVGGFKPFFRTHPPIAEVDGLAKKQFDFPIETQQLAPRLALANLKAEALGGNVVRLSAAIVNEGFLPTHPEMGVVGQQVYAPQVVWKVPEKTQWLQGSRRSQLPRIAGEGGHVERTWLVRLPKEVTEIEVQVGAPAIGQASATVTVTPEKK